MVIKGTLTSVYTLGGTIFKKAGEKLEDAGKVVKKSATKVGEKVVEVVKGE